MTTPVAPGELSPQRLAAIANGAERHPPMRLNVGPSDAIALSVTDTVIGACEYAARAFDLFKLEDDAIVMREVAKMLQERGKARIDAAAKPPPAVVTP